ncbi:hypothetical protein ACFC1R_28260 [Kitasatospora sp. NPDC056138]|uniref:hypothetical protein n=1 Tax=Kitasatospora sp. NPDC056138 TaxID=3345724 RepID=UPI0035DE1A5B
MEGFGKQSFESAYQQPLPDEYFRSLAPLRYRTPDFCANLLPAVVAGIRQRTGRRQLKVIDLACSYGINSALLKCGLTFADLAHRCLAPGDAARKPGEEIVQDAAFVKARTIDPDLTVVGVDVSHPAIAYALATGLIDAAVTTDLEHADPAEHEARALAGADLVLATGAFSYLGATTFHRILALQDLAPTVLGWPIYGSSTTAVERCLTRHGLTVTHPQPAPRHQRDFADARERDAYHSTLRRTKLPYLGTAAETSLCVTPILARPLMR